MRVDAYMRVPECEDLFAVGDIARYPDPWATGSFTWIKFWKNAIDTGDVAGRAVASSLGYGAKTSRIGYFPSMVTEVFGLRIEIAGNPKISDSVEIVCGDLDRLGHVSVYLHAGAHRA
ncbi:hypothetical protein ACOBQB_13730 [Streptomyces sp. G5(2025)]|uniref:hypothetical protein n=1 Tax=Streptomyces sp. G5(2025) TaxID=3406628 RepID=UPI003C190E59